MYLPFLAFFSIYWDLNIRLVSFPFSCISCILNCWWHIFLTIVCLKKVLFLHGYFHWVYSSYLLHFSCVFVCVLLLFTSLKISLHFILVCIVSDKKSDLHVIHVPVYIYISHFLLMALNFSLSLVLRNFLVFLIIFDGLCFCMWIDVCTFILFGIYWTTWIFGV